MKNKLSFATKIIALICIIFIVTFGIIYFIVNKNYKNSILEEEHSKIEVILNTISPLVSINMEFELHKNIEDIFSTMLQNNKQILYIELIDNKNKSLIKYGNKDTKSEYIKKTTQIYDTLNNKLATIQLYYSYDKYIIFVEKFNTLFGYIFLAIMITVLVLSQYLIKIFKPLNNLTNELLKYNPKTNRNLSLKHRNIVSDEFALINNVAVTMLDQIEMYTANLEEKIQKEVDKNIEKEKQLFEHTKKAQMGEMIGNIAHQWRQPLSVISTIASGLRMKQSYGMLNTEELPESFEAIEKQTQYLSDTIDTFRDFIKEEKTLKNVDIH